MHARMHACTHTPSSLLFLPVSYQEKEYDEYGTAAVVVYDIKSPKSKAIEQMSFLLLSPPPTPLIPALLSHLPTLLTCMGCACSR